MPALRSLLAHTADARGRISPLRRVSAVSGLHGRGRAPIPFFATGGLRVLPDFDFASAPPIDLLVVRGGFGTRVLLQDAGAIERIRRTAAAARHVISLCTGSLLQARAGLLASRRATTHWGALDLRNGGPDDSC